MSFKIAIHGVPDTDYSIIKRPLTTNSVPRLMNWKERFSGTRDVRHLKAKIAFLKYK